MRLDQLGVPLERDAEREDDGAVLLDRRPGIEEQAVGLAERDRVGGRLEQRLGAVGGRRVALAGA